LVTRVGADGAPMSDVAAIGDRIAAETIS